MSFIICSFCTFENKINRKNCLICENILESSSSFFAVSVASDSSSSSSRTKTNRNKQQEVEEREIIIEEEEEVTINCPFCTFKNKKSNKECEACSNNILKKKRVIEVIEDSDFEGLFYFLFTSLFIVISFISLLNCLFVCSID